MAEPTEIDGKEAAKELLLADHSYFTELFIRNEEVGETRVNWFIGIVTGAIGGLIALITNVELTPLLIQFVLIISLFALLAFGVVTLLRIVTRNRHTDGYKKDLDNLRQLFQDHFDPQGVLTNYHPLGPAPETRTASLPASESGERLRKFGGLTHTVAAINALVAGAIGGLIIHLVLSAGNVASTQRLLVSAGVAFTTLALSFFAQWRLVEMREGEARNELRRGRVTHAGGVVFDRTTANTVLYLLVRPSSGHEEWVLPKGRIEKRENHGEAALREVLEETGVRARIIHFLTIVEYETTKPVKAKFYLMEKVFETQSSEGRGTTWLTYQDALDKLTHPESKFLLAMAEKLRCS